MAWPSATNPASTGRAANDREIQNGREALTESIHGASDCHSWPCITPAAVRSATIRNSPSASSQKLQLAARAL